MSDLIGESVFFTVPDPSVLQPRLDELVIREITVDDLTVTGTVVIGAISVSSIEITGTTATIIITPDLSAQTVGAVTQSMLLYALPLDTVSTIVCTVSGITAAGNTLSIKASIRAKNIGGVATIGGIFDYFFNSDAALVGASVSFALAGTSLNFNANGVAAQTIRFSGVAEITQTAFS